MNGMFDLIKLKCSCAVISQWATNVFAVKVTSASAAFARLCARRDVCEVCAYSRTFAGVTSATWEPIARYNASATDTRTARARTSWTNVSSAITTLW